MLLSFYGFILFAFLSELVHGMRSVQCHFFVTMKNVKNVRNSNVSDMFLQLWLPSTINDLFCQKNVILTS